MTKAPCRGCEYEKEEKIKHPVCSICKKPGQYADQFGAAGLPNGRKDNVTMTEKQTKYKLTPTVQVATKTCKQCGSTKELDGFYVDATRADCHKSICKTCYTANQTAKNHSFKEIIRKIDQQAKPLPEILDEKKTAYAGEKKEAEKHQGPKDSEDKTPWEIFPFAEAEHVVRVFKKGAEKYGGPFTYRRGIPMEKLAAAAIRHATAILNGERIDPESGELHAAHISANGLMMISQSISEG